eukprot:874894-Prorocentrum_lima.AAC.1
MAHRPGACRPVVRHRGAAPQEVIDKGGGGTQMPVNNPMKYTPGRRKQCKSNSTLFLQQCY